MVPALVVRPAALVLGDDLGPRGPRPLVAVLLPVGALWRPPPRRLVVVVAAAVAPVPHGVLDGVDRHVDQPLDETLHEGERARRTVERGDAESRRRIRPAGLQGDWDLGRGGKEARVIGWWTPLIEWPGLRRAGDHPVIGLD